MSIIQSKPYPINPLRTINKIPRTLAFMGRSFVFVSALTTSYGFYLPVVMKCQEMGFNWYVCQTLAILAALLSAKITDYGLVSIIEYVLFYGVGLPIRAFAQKAGYGPYYKYWASQPYRHYFLHPIIWLLMVCMGAGLFYVDRFAALIASNSIQNIAPQHERKNVVGIQAEMTKQNNAALAPMVAAIKAAENTIKGIEKNVEAKQPGLVKLINSRGAAWETTELAKYKDRATAKEKKRLEKLRSDYTAALAATSTAQATLITQTVTDDAAIASSNAQIASLTGQSAYAFGWWMKIAGLGTHLLLVAFMFAKGENLDVNGDGSLDLADMHAFSGTQAKKFFSWPFFG